MFYRSIKLKEYGTHIDIVIGKTEDNIEFSKKRYKNTKPEDIKYSTDFIKDNAGGLLTLEEKSGSKAWFIFMNIEFCEKKFIGTLVHELHHAFRAIDRYYQVDSEEFVSYLLGHYTEYILKEYEKEKEKCLKSE